MPPARPTRLPTVRAAARLLCRAAEGTADVVEGVHAAVQAGALPLGRATRERTRGLTGFVYGCVRGGIRLTGQAVDAGLALAAGGPAQAGPATAPNSQRAALNGVFGDHLAETGNPLAIEMTLCHDGHPLDPRAPHRAMTSRGTEPAPTRLVVLVHGLCMHDGHWLRHGHDHGAALAQDHGLLPLYLRYNSGLPIADNGRRLAALLETLVRHWDAPVNELVIVGHSMGGLVARSACHHAAVGEHRWLPRLRKLVFLGSPHLGAPLERAGHALDLALQASPYSRPFSRLSRARSAGITDLRHGRLSATGDGVPLPDGVACYAIGAVRGPTLRPLRDRWLGDGLVPLQSALGRHRDPTLALGIPDQHQWVGLGMSHEDLLSHPAVYARLSAWLGGT